jgi:hypothetical protein
MVPHAARHGGLFRLVHAHTKHLFKAKIVSSVRNLSLFSGKQGMHSWFDEQIYRFLGQKIGGLGYWGGGGVRN